MQEKLIIKSRKNALIQPASFARKRGSLKIW